MKISEVKLRQIIREELARSSGRLLEGKYSKKALNSSLDKMIHKLVDERSDDLSLMGYQVAASAYRDILEKMNEMGAAGSDSYKMLASKIAHLFTNVDALTVGEHLIGTLGVHPLVALEVVDDLYDSLYEAADDEVHPGMIGLKTTLAKMVANSEDPAGDMGMILDYIAVSPQQSEEIISDVMDNFAELSQTWR